MSPLTEDDHEFLRRPLYGILTTAEGQVPPQPRPVWFEAGEDGTIHLFTAPGAVKVRRLRDHGAPDLVARLFAR